MIYGKTQYGDFWQGMASDSQVCADVPEIGFCSFPDKDSAVNALYMQGHRELAREINKAFAQHVAERIQKKGVNAMKIAAFVNAVLLIAAIVSTNFTF